MHTPPERFREYVDYLKQNGFHVIAMRDLAKYIDSDQPAKDAMTMVHYAGRPTDLPREVLATRADASFWLNNMLEHHHYTVDEAAGVFGMPAKSLESRMPAYAMDATTWPEKPKRHAIAVMPYPGGRHPRIGFLDGAVAPQRGTKASAFAPWDDTSCAVIDLPEAIFSNLGLIYLAHTHVPTIWDEQHRQIDNVDWERHPNGELTSTWHLPNKISFGARIVPQKNAADLELWLENGTDETLTGLRTQICVMLKGMAGFSAQTNDNKRLEGSVAAVKSDDGNRWLVVAFDHCGRVWANPKCPCMHSDPVLPDAAPGERVSVKGRVWFLDKSTSIDREVSRAKRRFHALPKD